MNTNFYVPESAELRIVGGKLGLSGQNINFKNESFFSLEVGQMIIQIGNGKENGTIRTDLFINPVKYVGSIVCNFAKKEKLYAFMLSEKSSDVNYYVLYGSTPDEIFTEAVYSMKDRVTGKTSSYVRFYKPVFVIVDKDFVYESEINFLTEKTLKL